MADELIDDKTVFAALQNELNARVIARASINTAHVQTILAFVAASFAVRFLPAPASIHHTYWVTATIPLISIYFIALYRHNDMQVGLLNRCLRRIEARAVELPRAIRFYMVGGEYRDTFEARRWSHYAVVALSAVSPALLAPDLWKAVTSLRGSQLAGTANAQAVYTFLWCLVCSGLNVFILMDLQRYRDGLLKDDETPAVNATG